MGPVVQASRRRPAAFRAPFLPCIRDQRQVSYLRGLSPSKQARDDSTWRSAGFIQRGGMLT